MGNSEIERLTKLETQIESLLQLVIRLEAKLDARESNFVSKEILNEKLRLQENRIDNLQNEIKKVQNEKQASKQILPQWVATVASYGALILALYAYFAN